MVPPAALPAFLELGRDAWIGPVLADLEGERGRWLAGLDEDWLAFLPLMSSATELAVLRGVDPAAAREQVAAEWARASADDRVILLSTLLEGLSLDDVPFLESALGDRSAAVSVRAATLLAVVCGPLRLDDLPPFGRRAVDRARPVVRVARQGLLRSPMLEVAAPEALDDHVRSDGIVERAERVPAGAAGRVAEQIIRRAPLSLWENEFRRSPADLVALPGRR